MLELVKSSDHVACVKALNFTLGKMGSHSWFWAEKYHDMTWIWQNYPGFHVGKLLKVGNNGNYETSEGAALLPEVSILEPLSVYWTMVPLRYVSQILSMRLTLCGKTIFANVINGFEIRSSWVTLTDPKTKDQCPHKT